MLGTIVNAIAIIAGGMVGTLLKSNMKQKYSDTIIKAIALCVFIIGVSKALETANLLLIILSLAVGSIIGEFIDIEMRLDKLGDRVKDRFAKGNNDFSVAFVTTTLIFCVGSMAILGAIESGISGNHETLFAKSTLDGIFSVVFASTFGIGVCFSAIPVFIYQGIITLGAGYLKDVLTADAIREMSAAGGILIMALSLNMLEVKKIKVGNMLPAVFIPLVYYMIVG